LEAEFSSLLKIFQAKSFSVFLTHWLKNGLWEQLIHIREDGNLLAKLQQKALHHWWMGFKKWVLWFSNCGQRRTPSF